MDIPTAEKLSLLLMRINASLDDSVAFVRDHCDVHDLNWWRREVGKVMGAIYLDIEEKLWTQHPELRPREMNGTYKVDPTIFEPRFYAVRRADDV